MKITAYIMLFGLCLIALSAQTGLEPVLLLGVILLCGAPCTALIIYAWLVLIRSSKLKINAISPTDKADKKKMELKEAAIFLVIICSVIAFFIACALYAIDPSLVFQTLFGCLIVGVILLGLAALPLWLFAILK